MRKKWLLFTSAQGLWPKLGSKRELLGVVVGGEGLGEVLLCSLCAHCALRDTVLVGAYWAGGLAAEGA